MRRGGEPFPEFWRRDLRRALAAEGRSAVSVGDCGFLVLAALVFGLCALILYAEGGYHAGFSSLNALGAVKPQGPWEWVTAFGDERFVVALALLSSLRSPRVFWAFMVAAAVGVLYARGLKWLFDAARPPAVLPSDGFNLIGAAHRRSSFPSGHSVAVGLLAGVWLCFVRERWLRWGLLILTVQVAMSRVVVGVHWPVDVLSGLTGGMLSAWMGARVSASWRWGTEVRGHALLVLLGTLFLIPGGFVEGDYPTAAWMLNAVALIAVARVVWGYAWDPWWRWRHGHTGGNPG